MRRKAALVSIVENFYDSTPFIFPVFPEETGASSLIADHDTTYSAKQS